MYFAIHLEMPPNLNNIFYILNFKFINPVKHCLLNPSSASILSISVFYFFNLTLADSVSRSHVIHLCVETHLMSCFYIKQRLCPCPDHCMDMDIIYQPQFMFKLSDYYIIILYYNHHFYISPY